MLSILEIPRHRLRWWVGGGSETPHMEEEDEEEEDTVRIDWQSGMFEKSTMRCETCGDRNAWGRVHVCCDQQCKGTINT